MQFGWEVEDIKTTVAELRARAAWYSRSTTYPASELLTTLRR